MQTLRILAAATAIYAVYLPVATVVGRHHVPIPRPAGSVVEKIGGFQLDHPDNYFVRSHIFTPARFPDPSRIAVYEGLTPLSETRFTADGGAYVVRFKASDGSDPRTNERNYWVVLPRSAMEARAAD